MGKIIGSRASAGHTVPGAPTIGTATAGDAQATITFTAPTNTGKLPITSYTVTSSPGSITASGASSPITVTGLTNSTAYTFTVTATNSTGTSASSNSSNSATPVAPITPFITVNYDQSSGPNGQGVRSVDSLSTKEMICYSSVGTSTSAGGSNRNWQSIIDKFNVGTPSLVATTGIRNQTINTAGYDTYARGLAVDSNDDIYTLAAYYNSGGISRPLLVKNNSSLSQQWVFYGDNSGGNSAFPQALRLDKSGNLRFCGYRQAGTTMGFVARMNKADGTITGSVGFYENSAQQGTYCNDVAYDNSGNYYAVGWYYNSSGYQVAYSQKFNSSNSFSGVINIPNPNGTSRNTSFSCVRVDSSGNQYYGGFMENSSQGRQALLYKSDSSGNRVWGKRIVSSLAAGSQYTFISDMWLDETNSALYVFGSDFRSGSQYIGFVAKFDLNGNNQWIRNIYSNGDAYSTAVMTTIAGGGGVGGYPIFQINQSTPANETSWYFTGAGVLPPDGSLTGTKSVTTKTSSPTGVISYVYAAGSYTFPNETTWDNVAGMTAVTSVITGGGPGTITTSPIGVTNAVATI